jgi:hypothetical protein
LRCVRWPGERQRPPREVEFDGAVVSWRAPWATWARVTQSTAHAEDIWFFRNARPPRTPNAASITGPRHVPLAAWSLRYHADRALWKERSWSAPRSRGLVAIATPLCLGCLVKAGSRTAFGRFISSVGPVGGTINGQFQRWRRRPCRHLGHRSTSVEFCGSDAVGCAPLMMQSLRPTFTQCLR